MLILVIPASTQEGGVEGVHQTWQEETSGCRRLQRGGSRTVLEYHRVPQQPWPAVRYGPAVYRHQGLGEDRARLQRAQRLLPGQVQNRLECGKVTEEE